MSKRFMKKINGAEIFCLEYDKETLKDMVLEKQEEIERLKERLDIAQTAYLSIDKRISKAIEYIERRDIDWGSEEHTELLNILEGDDNGKN